MSETYQQIANTLESNLSNVQDYIQKLQSNKGQKVVDNDSKLNI